MNTTIHAGNESCDFGSKCQNPATATVALSFNRHPGSVEIRTYCDRCEGLDALVWAGKEHKVTRTVIARTAPMFEAIGLIDHPVEENADGSRFCYGCDTDVSDDEAHDPVTA